MPDSVRLGVIGLGNIGLQHIKNVVSGAVKRAEVAGISSRQVPTNKLLDGIPHYSDYQTMLQSGQVDAVLIASPTMLHQEMGEAACEAGLHIIMEKPLGMSVAEAQSLINAAADKQRFAVMLNQRCHPAYRRIKEIIDEGQLGEFQRIHWSMTAWYRPDIYYRVSDWRGTWPGEGGGLLINQCIHNLDILQWLVGLPNKVSSIVGFGKYHEIDVEDEVTAMFSYDNGATGVLVASSGEAPGINQLDIVGDKGTLRYDGTTLTLSTTEQNVTEHCRNTQEMFGMPNFQQSSIDTNEPVNQHAIILQNFVDAILDGVPLITPATEGVASIELANAILLSAWQDESVTLPIDADVYQQVLDEKIRQSSLRKPETLDVQIDMGKSFR
ncbi:MAG: Gfo/Idh/MocA family oxidoreductase [Pseudomonadota bacterium]